MTDQAGVSVPVTKVADTDGDPGGAGTRTTGARAEQIVAWAAGLLAVAISWYASRGRMATAPDSVTYLSTAASLRAGDGFGNWLESPMATFPPGWPGVIAGVPFVSTSTAAFLVLALSLLLLPLLSLGILRRTTSSTPARIIGVVAVTLSPTVLPWTYTGLSEVPFTALVLGVVLAALASRESRRWLWVAAGLAALAPLVRYIGVSTPIALAAWVAFDRRRARRWITAAGVVVIGLVPIGGLLLWNQSQAGASMGGRTASALSPIQAAGQALATIGRTAVWTFDRVPTPIGLLLSVAVIALAALAVFGARASDVERARRGRALLALIAVVQTLTLIAARSRVEMDDLDGRLLATTAALVLLLAACLLGDLQLHPSDTIRKVALVAGVAWCVIGFGAVGRGVLTLPGGYEGDEWETARSIPALDDVPEECRQLTVGDVDGGEFPDCGVLANEPWGWYPSSFRPLPSPRRGPDGQSAELDRLRDAVADGSTVYVLWTTVDEPWGSYVPVADMEQELKMTELGSGDGIAVYRVDGVR